MTRAIADRGGETLSALVGGEGAVYVEVAGAAAGSADGGPAVIVRARHERK